jgi:hypothetical protein
MVRRSFTRVLVQIDYLSVFMANPSTPTAAITCNLTVLEILRQKNASMDAEGASPGTTADQQAPLITSLVPSTDKNGITPFLLWYLHTNVVAEGDVQRPESVLTLLPWWVSVAAGDEDTAQFFIKCKVNVYKKSTRGLWSAPHFAANEYVASQRCASQSANPHNVPTATYQRSC